MKILIGQPILDSVEAETHSCFKALQNYCFKNNFELGFSDDIGTRFVNIARNHIAQMAIKELFDYVMFIDSDMTFPKDSIERLLEHDKDVVGGAYFSRIWPHPPCVFGEYDDETGRFPLLIEPYLSDSLPPFMKAGGMATGFLLIKTHVFRTIPYPWFDYTHNKHGVFFTEDVFFNVQMHKYGIDVWVDNTLNIGHIGKKAFTKKDLLIANTSPEGNSDIHNLIRLDRTKAYATI